MLYFHYTEKLIDLQNLIVKNVAQDQNSTTIFAQIPRKPHNCPCCHTSTTVLTGGGGNAPSNYRPFCQIVCRGVQSTNPTLTFGDSIDSKLCLKCKKSLDFKRFFLYQLYR